MAQWLLLFLLTVHTGAARADEAEESDLWTETIRGAYGQFAIRIDEKEGSVSVLRGDQREQPMPVLRVRLLRPAGEVLVALEKVSHEGSPPRFEGKAKEWNGTLSGFVLEKSEGAGWAVMGKFEKFQSAAHYRR